jgi:hypothetical protein
MSAMLIALLYWIIMQPVPFWFTQIVDQVEKIPYQVRREEVASGGMYLEVQGKRVNNMSLNRLLGRGEKSKRASTQVIL